MPGPAFIPTQPKEPYVPRSAIAFSQMQQQQQQFNQQRQRDAANREISLGQLGLAQKQFEHDEEVYKNKRAGLDRERGMQTLAKIQSMIRDVPDGPGRQLLQTTGEAMIGKLYPTLSKSDPAFPKTFFGFGEGVYERDRDRMLDTMKRELALKAQAEKNVLKAKEKIARRELVGETIGKLVLGYQKGASEANLARIKMKPADPETAKLELKKLQAETTEAQAKAERARRELDRALDNASPNDKERMKNFRRQAELKAEGLAMRENNIVSLPVPQQADARKAVNAEYQKLADDLKAQEESLLGEMALKKANRSRVERAISRARKENPKATNAQLQVLVEEILNRQGFTGMQE